MYYKRHFRSTERFRLKPKNEAMNTKTAFSGLFHRAGKHHLPCQSFLPQPKELGRFTAGETRSV